MPRTVSPLKMMRSARLRLTLSAGMPSSAAVPPLRTQLQAQVDRRAAAGHLEQDVDAVAPCAPLDLVDEIGLR